MEIARIHLDHWLEYATVRGVKPHELQVNFPSITTGKKDNNQPATIPASYFYDVLQFIFKALNDDLIGIKAGQFLTLKLLGLIYQISLQTRTIEEALHYLSSYLNSTFRIVRFETAITEMHITISVHIQGNNEAVNRIVSENLLTIISREIAMMAAEEVSFVLTSPYYHNGYPAGWHKGDFYAVSFEQVVLKAAIRERKDQQLDVLIPRYLQLIETYKTTSAFSDKVKITLLSLSDPALPHINRVAEALYITPRTLQRKLEAEQNSFRQLSEDVKKEIASSLLRHQGYPIAGMAYVLGYADAASFIHSFKKWFGISPERMRFLYSDKKYKGQHND